MSCKIHRKSKNAIEIRFNDNDMATIFIKEVNYFQYIGFFKHKKIPIKAYSIYLNIYDCQFATSKPLQAGLLTLKEAQSALQQHVNKYLTINNATISFQSDFAKAQELS